MLSLLIKDAITGFFFFGKQEPPAIMIAGYTTWSVFCQKQARLGYTGPSRQSQYRNFQNISCTRLSRILRREGSLYSTELTSLTCQVCGINTGEPRESDHQPRWSLTRPLIVSDQNFDSLAYGKQRPTCTHCCTRFILVKSQIRENIWYFLLRNFRLLYYPGMRERFICERGKT